MSELLDKQVNAQKEINFRGSCKPTKKCAMKMKQRNKQEINDTRVKMLLIEGGHL